MLRLFCILLCFTAVTVYAEYIRNPGFENGETQWSLDEWSTPRGKGKFKVVSGMPFEGSKCAEVSHVSGGDNLLLHQRIPLAGRHSLQLKFAARANVRVNASANIGAAFITRGASGEQLQYIHRTFSAKDQWQLFQWRFLTDPDTVTIDIYLRNDKTTVWYDAVSLADYSGISLDKSIAWIPENQVVLLFSQHGGMDSPREVMIEIVAPESDQLYYREKHSLNGEKPETVLNVPGLQSGFWRVIVKSLSGNLLAESSFEWRCPDRKNGRQNNFVRRLFDYPARDRNLPDAIPVKLDRDNWIYVKLESETPLKLLCTPLRTPLILNGRGEAMRYLEKGGYTLTLEGNKSGLKSLQVSEIPELILCEYESKISHRRYWDLMQTRGAKELQEVCNVGMEFLEGSDKVGGERISNKDLRRIHLWRNAGRNTIVNLERPGMANIPVEKTLEYWGNSIGMLHLDGIAIDEFAWETPEMVKYYETAIQAFNQGKEWKKRRIYAFCCAAWYDHRQTRQLRELLRKGNGYYAPEIYLREQPTELQAIAEIDGMMNYLRLWEKAEPGASSRSVVTLSCTDGNPGFYDQDTFASVNYKFFLDMQMNLLANDPAFEGIRGVSAWILRYSRPDTIKWLALLYRHYCIEGKTSMLSLQYDYHYKLPHLQNPDFMKGLEGWIAEPAGENTIATGNLPGWGYARGTCNISPFGDDFVLMKRIPGKYNRIRQPLKSLNPGETYMVSFRAADYDDIMNGRKIRRIHPLNLEITNAEIQYQESSIIAYQSDHTMPPLFPSGKRVDGPCLTQYNLVFTAGASEMELLISDRLPDEKIPVAEDGGSALPASEERPAVMLNFIQVQPLLPDNL